MLATAALTLAHPWLSAIAFGLGALAVLIARRRRPAIRWGTGMLSAAALVLLALAAGGLTWHRPASGEVVVMVDLSASTRGASYRDRAELNRRVGELLGATPYRVVYFSDHNTADAPGAAKMPDMPGERTVFAPPAGIAVVLFSDGRFAIPAAVPPTFVVADPALDWPDDAAVTQLETRGERIAATVNVGGPARRLTIDAAATRPTETIEAGHVTVARAIRGNAVIATADLDKGDAWPENDSLSLAVAPAMRSQRWWVSATGDTPLGEWVSYRPQDFPSEPAALLAPSVIVMANVAAADLSGMQQERLEQYVRDLGGALVIAGGDRAFAAGGYTGTALEALSPLASVPPAPAVHWILLADSSGSMSEAVSGGAGMTRWQLAASAIAGLVPALPADDPVSIGSFAGELRWWSTGRNARELAPIPLPPAGVSPGGPTNLAAALDRVATEATGGLAGELLVVSDADTTIGGPDALIAKLRAKRIRLHVLAIGDGRGLDTLRRMTDATGGTLRRQFDPKQWAADARQMLTAAWPNRLIASATGVMFKGELTALLGRSVAPWNRTWLRPSAVELGSATHGNEVVPMCARWTAGAGEVIASAFSPSAGEAEAMANLIVRAPRDPRFAVTWEAGTRLNLRVDVADRGKYLNSLTMHLDLSSTGDDQPTPTVYEVPQVAPGRYELSMEAPRSRRFATLRDAGHVVDRVAVTARYAPEFDAVGNDYDAMRSLASRTGGAVMDRAMIRPIDIPFPRRELFISGWLALAASVLLAGALAHWRKG